MALSRCFHGNISVLHSIDQSETRYFVEYIIIQYIHLRLLNFLVLTIYKYFNSHAGIVIVRDRIKPNKSCSSWAANQMLDNAGSIRVCSKYLRKKKSTVSTVATVVFKLILRGNKS